MAAEEGGSSSMDKTEHEMTFDEKCQLSHDMDILSGDDLGRIFKMIQEREPSLRDIPAEEVVIDLEKLSNSTLQELKRCVYKCLSRNADGSKEGQ